MKFNRLSALFVILALPIAAFASADTDRKIEKAAKASYNYRAVLENHISVKARDGIVTLTGTVQDEGDKTLAADTVENLPGVTGVKNNIKIKPKYPENSDAWIALKIRTHLLTRANVSAAGTKVALNHGHVILSGTAATWQQKELTSVYAKEITGVKSVLNNMEVKAAPATATLAENIDDASITSQVKYALFTHKSTSALQTKVVTTDGVVRVTGDASSDAEKSLVTKLAGDIRGTKSVTNDMVVKS